MDIYIYGQQLGILYGACAKFSAQSLGRGSEIQYGGVWVEHWALYIWRKHANLSSVKQLKPKTWRISDELWRHFTNLTSFLWQRLKVVTASQAQYWARGCFHTPLDFLKDIFYFCSKFSHLSMRMIFMDFIWTFTFYSKMYKLFKISLALERNEELIKSWKCGQLRYFRSDSRQGIGTKYMKFRTKQVFESFSVSFF